MKKKLIIFILVLLLFITGCSNNQEKKEKTSKEEIKDVIVEKVTNQMKNMTIEEKIAQMLVVYYSSYEVDETLISLLESTTPGGFIVMGDNINTYDQTKKFIDDLNKYSKIPMIISTDEEGGNVQRLEYLTDIDVTHIPYMYDVGKTNDENVSKKVAKVMAEELRTLGINLTYAPVLDIYSNPNNTIIGKRSFGESKELVSKMAIAFNEGLEENNIMGAYKHFPGHGDTDVDSHEDLPIINKTYEELKEEELVPFQYAIDKGAKMIMVGHIALPNITGDNTPASLSKKVITDILKTDMKYDGLVITDALDMGALTNNYTDEEIYTMAINAGVDLLLMPNGSKNAIEYIKNNISEERINESVKKILTFKYKYLSDYKYLDKSYLGSEEHKSIVSSISN